MKRFVFILLLIISCGRISPVEPDPVLETVMDVDSFPPHWPCNPDSIKMAEMIPLDSIMGCRM